MSASGHFLPSESLTSDRLLLLRIIRCLPTSKAFVIAMLVLSHWVLDLLTHRPDMPITLNDPYLLGFGLWNFPFVAVPLELLMFGTGIWLFTRHTMAKNRQGSIGLWVLILFLLVVYVASLFGPPPPSSAAVAWSAQALWLLIAWGFWVDHNRVIKPIN
jgi:hypothetical protein